MTATVLITGFGPFPGMPFNPTGPLVKRLSRIRRPAVNDIRLHAHIFRTSYAAVDRDLPDLLLRYHPDILLMFGVAGRTPYLRIETRATNRRSTLLPDAAQTRMISGVIERGAQSTRPLRADAARLLTAARRARVPALISHDAGRYLCNYLYWRALTYGNNGTRQIAFIHVPKLARKSRPRAKSGRQHPSVTLDDLVRAGEALLLAMLAQHDTQR